jgi:hypothetical protein
MTNKTSPDTSGRTKNEHMKKLLILVIQVCCCGILFAQTLPLKADNSDGGAQLNAIIVNPQNPLNCEDCKPEKVKINVSPSYSISFYNNNSFTLSQNIFINTTPSKLIRSIKAELSYFEFLPENENCLVCNKDATTYGNFNSGTAALLNGAGAGTHAFLFSFLPPKPSGSFPVQFNISMPPTVNCCDVIVRFCIRYTVAFDDCTFCNVLVCYQRKMKGDLLIEQPIANNNQN